jgi:hypothetical protein
MSEFTIRALVAVIAMSGMISARAEEATDMRAMHEQHMNRSGVATSPPYSSSGLADPVQALDNLDSRQPVPLLPRMANHQKQNMRGHLEAVQGIIFGLAQNDFNSIEKAAQSMGLTNETKQMCEMMGAGAKGFSERAIDFHQSADQIAGFAKKRDARGVLTSLNLTLNQCTGCHATYKQKIVNQAAWEAITKNLFTSKPTDSPDTHQENQQR